MGITGFTGSSHLLFLQIFHRKRLIVAAKKLFSFEILNPSKFLSHICLLQKQEHSIVGTDHGVWYKNETPQPDNQKDLAPCLAFSFNLAPRSHRLCCTLRHYFGVQKILWQLDNKWKHLLPKGKRLRSQQLSSWKIYSLSTFFDICLSPQFSPLPSSRVHYQVCALSPFTNEHSNI